MTRADSVALPTLTQIQTWRAEHLDAAADEWMQRADAWEKACSAVVQEVSQPGGTPWDGAAAEAAAQRVTGDRHAVLDAADSLNSAAAIASAGAVHIRIARQVALDNVRAALSAGFDVEDDLTIVDTTMSLSSARQREAVALRHAESIWRAADVLVATDRSVAGRLVEAIKGLESLRFPAEPDADSPNVLMAGFGGPLPPLPAAPHLIYCYPSARPDFWWCEGYDIGGGPYGFDSPIDVSGVG